MVFLQTAAVTYILELYTYIVDVIIVKSLKKKRDLELNAPSVDSLNKSLIALWEKAYIHRFFRASDNKATIDIFSYFSLESREKWELLISARENNRNFPKTNPNFGKILNNLRMCFELMW